MPLLNTQEQDVCRRLPDEILNPSWRAPPAPEGSGTNFLFAP